MSDVRDPRASVEAMRALVSEVAAEGGWTGPFPATVDRLYDVARTDLCLARLVEGHADAMRIIDQASAEPRPGVYGVWASRSAGTGLSAKRDGDAWLVDGELRFASGVDIIDRALVTAWVDEETHLLFDLDVSSFRPDRSSWQSSGMDASRSFTVRADAVAAADVIGSENFYLRRPGFVVGGLGVAAVWAGGAQRVTDLVVDGLRAFAATPHQLRRLGAMRQASWEATTLVHHVAGGLAERDDRSTSAEVAGARTAVATACDRVLSEAALVVGPGGLSGNVHLARTMADLQMYVRQHHLDSTLQALGRAVIDASDEGR